MSTIKKVIKNVRRSLAGWNGGKDAAGRPQKPKDVIKRFDATYKSKEDLQKMASQKANAGSPADLQIKRAKRNLRMVKK